MSVIEQHREQKDFICHLMHLTVWSLDMVSNTDIDFLRWHHHGPESWSVLNKCNHCHLALFHLPSLADWYWTSSKEKQDPSWCCGLAMAARPVPVLVPKAWGVQVKGCQWFHSNSAPARHPSHHSWLLRFGSLTQTPKIGARCINPELLPDNTQQHFLQVQFKQVETNNPELSLEAAQLHFHTTTSGFNKPPR